MTSDEPLELNPPKLAAELRVAMSRVNRRMRQERPVTGLSDGEFSTMATLYNKGELSLRELAARNHVKPPSMTRIIQSLADKHMVERKPHPTDGRATLIALTELGQTEVKETRQARLAWLGSHLQTLSLDERKVLAQATKILSTLEQTH